MILSSLIQMHESTVVVNFRVYLHVILYFYVRGLFTCDLILLRMRFIGLEASKGILSKNVTIWIEKITGQTL